VCVCVCIICGIFNGVISGLHYVASSDRVCRASQIGKDVDKSSWGLIVGAFLKFAWRDRRKVWNVRFGLVGVWNKTGTHKC
jgi:hypothetical protein